MTFVLYLKQRRGKNNKKTNYHAAVMLLPRCCNGVTKPL